MRSSWKKGGTSWNKGLHLSAEHRKKIGDARRGKKRSPEQVEKMKQYLKPPSQKGRKRSLESRARISASQRGKIIPPEVRAKIGRKGPLSSNWKGGITEQNRIIRGSVEYREWRMKVFRRDRFACVIGGFSHGKKLHADHIKSFAKYPELRLEVNNGRTLCWDCHKKTDTYGRPKGKQSVDNAFAPEQHVR